MENKEIVLSVKDLHVNFSTDNGYVQAVRGVSFDLYKGETLCIVGESGSGKSVTSKTIMGILAANGRIAEGSIMYEGEDLTKVSEDEFHRIRGRKIGMIFQDPLSSLNPIMRIGKQITEAMILNGNHLKKMREEIVAKEFVAYKNTITEYKSELNKSKEVVKFLNSEKKKELERVKSIAKNESSGRIFALNQDYGLEKISIKHKFKKMLEEQPENAKEIQAQKAEAYKEARARYIETKNTIKAEAKAKHSSNKQLLNSIKKDFDEKIKKARVENAANKQELKAKYKPLIAETKAAYLENEDGRIIARCVIFTEAHDQNGKVWRLAERQYAEEGRDFLKRCLVDALIDGGYIDAYKRVGVDCHKTTAYVDIEGNSLQHLKFSIECKLEFSQNPDDAWDSGKCHILSYQDSFKYFDPYKKIAYNSEPDDYSNIFMLDTTNCYLEGNWDDYHECWCRDYYWVWKDGEECRMISMKAIRLHSVTMELVFVHAIAELNCKPSIVKNIASMTT